MIEHKSNTSLWLLINYTCVILFHQRKSWPTGYSDGIWILDRDIWRSRTLDVLNYFYQITDTSARFFTLFISSKKMLLAHEDGQSKVKKRLKIS